MDTKSPNEQSVRIQTSVLNRLGIGEIISVEAQMRVSEADYASMLRASVYDIVESDRR